VALAGGVLAYVLWAGAPEKSGRRALPPPSGPHSVVPDSAVPDSQPGSGLGSADEAKPAGRLVEVTDPAGSTGHVLIGRVVDEEFRGVPHADVYWATDERSSGISVERLDREKLAWVQRSETRTDGLGAFRVVRSASSHGRLAVRARGFVPYEVLVPLTSDLALDLGDIVLRTGIVLRGRVLDVARVPVAGARVRRLESDAIPSAVLGSSDGDAVVITDADGGFVIADLAPGSWSLLVKAVDHPDKLERGIAEAGRAVSGVEIVLEYGLEIGGRVKHAPAEALGTLWIRAVPISGAPVGVLYAGEHADPERFVVLPRGAHCAADGSFVVRGLTAGFDYRLSGRVGEHDYFGAVRTGQVIARAGARDVELVYRAGTVLTFQVVDGSTSAPLTDFEVRLGRGHPEPLAGDDGSVRHTFIDGRVRVTHGLDGGETPLQLEVEARGYETAVLSDLRVTPGQVNDIGVVRLVPAPVITLRVVDDATGAPVAGARVRLASVGPGARVLSTNAESHDLHAADSDADGRARLNALGGESVRLTVEHPDFAPFRSEMVGSFAVARDEVARLQKGGTVIVLVRDALGVAVRGVRIRHTSSVQDVAPDDPREPDRSKTDAEGRLVFEHLVAGEHSFEIEVSRPTPLSSAAGEDVLVRDSAPRRVAVADGSTETLSWFVPARGRTTGRVIANAQGVSGATLHFTPRGAAGAGASDSAESLVARTNGNGDYVLSSVELGTYGVTVVHSSRRMAFETEVSIEALQHSFDIVLPLTSIRGRIVDGDGRPLAGVRVHVERAAASGSAVNRARSTDFAAETGADGSYVLEGVQGDVDLVVEARHPGFQSAPSDIVRVAQGETRPNVDFALAPGAALEVAVVRASPSCRVRATYAQGQDRAVLDALVPLGANGTARFTGLRPGRWRIQLEDCADPAPGSSSATHEQWVEVAANLANSVRFELP